MSELTTQNIKMVRGASKAWKILVPGGENNGCRILDTGEKLVFGVVQNPDSESYLIKKILTSADYDAESDRYILKLDPADTENLGFLKYHYDVWLVSGGEKIPIIGYSSFEVTSNAVSSNRGLE